MSTIVRAGPGAEPIPVECPSCRSLLTYEPWEVETLFRNVGRDRAQYPFWRDEPDVARERGGPRVRAIECPCCHEWIILSEETPEETEARLRALDEVPL